MPKSKVFTNSVIAYGNMIDISLVHHEEEIRDSLTSALSSTHIVTIYKITIQYETGCVLHKITKSHYKITWTQTPASCDKTSTCLGDPLPHHVCIPCCTPLSLPNWLDNWLPSIKAKPPYILSWFMASLISPMIFTFWFPQDHAPMTSMGFCFSPRPRLDTPSWVHTPDNPNFSWRNALRFLNLAGLNQVQACIIDTLLKCKSTLFLHKRWMENPPPTKADLKAPTLASWGFEVEFFRQPTNTKCFSCLRTQRLPGSTPVGLQILALR